MSWDEERTDGTNRANPPLIWQFTRMNPRKAPSLLSRFLSEFAAVVLFGPRQAGKTTLALAEAERRGDSLYLDLELPSAQRQLDDPEAFLMAQPALKSNARQHLQCREAFIWQPPMSVLPESCCLPRCQQVTPCAMELKS